MMHLNHRRLRGAPILVFVALGGAFGAWQIRAQAPIPEVANTSDAGGEPAASYSVAARGRIEPRAGIIRVAGPSRPVVVAELLIEQGDVVARDQVIAVLDDHDALEASVARLDSESRDAAKQLERLRRLRRAGIISTAELEAAETRAAVVAAELRRAQARRDTALVRAPLAGVVLDVVTRRGERVGADGIAIIADTSQMDVLAEVYETDAPAIAVGQSAMITSSVLAAPVSGQVVRIGRMIGRQRAFDTDPTTAIDRRVIEVRIALDSPEVVADLTNLQVDVKIHAGDDAGRGA